jgi:hypothetical protein
MSLVKYILQSCNGDLKYRVNFTGETSLTVGETWFVECGGIEDGCYEVVEDNNEVLDEYNSDECMFIEYGDCSECKSSTDDLLAIPSTWIYLQCPDDSRPPLIVTGKHTFI